MSAGSTPLRFGCASGHVRLGDAPHARRVTEERRVRVRVGGSGSARRGLRVRRDEQVGLHADVSHLAGPEQIHAAHFFSFSISFSASFFFLLLLLRFRLRPPVVYAAGQQRVSVGHTWTRL